MAKYILKSGANLLLKSGNTILTSSDETPNPILDINPENWPLSNGAVVPLLADSSSNNNNFSQNDPAKRAVIVTNSINGLPSFKFSGNGYYQSSFGIPFRTIFLVVKAAVITQGGGTLFDSANLDNFGYFMSTNDNQNLWFGITGVSGIYGSFIGNRLFGNGNRVSFSDAIRSLNYVLLCCDVVIHSDKSLNYIGAYHNFGNPAGFFSGEYARILAFKDRLTELHRKEITSQLLTKYNL